jgi:hypoxanthine phosphoribosyltransferase
MQVLSQYRTKMIKEQSQPALKPVFAHPIEASFTTILNYYGIEWKYEPRAFPLQWDGEENVIEAFTPDFYLPQQDLYVELTTLRPKLNNFKNRRIRRLKELYPEVNIKLLNRRDLHKLMIKFGLEDEARSIQGTQAQTRN